MNLVGTATPIVAISSQLVGKLIFIAAQATSASIIEGIQRKGFLNPNLSQSLGMNRKAGIAAQGMTEVMTPVICGCTPISPNSAGVHPIIVFM